MRQGGIAFVSGLLFAFGLTIGGMTQPSKVLGFLDVTGAWDPSLAGVMIGAIAVFTPAYWWSRSWTRPRVGLAFSSWTHDSVDMRLVVGAILFGCGWGLAGYCPGPALTASVTVAIPILCLCGAMVAGSWGTVAVQRMLDRRRAART